MNSSLLSTRQSQARITASRKRKHATRGTSTNECVAQMRTFVREATSLLTLPTVVRRNTDGSKKKGKLQSPAEGPYRVQQRSDRTFTIDRKGATEVINSDRVTKAPRPHNAPAFVPEPGQLNKVTDGPEYTVQKILKHRVAAGDDQFEFLIKWADYEDPSRTKRDLVPEELISRYFRRRQRRSARATRPAITRGTSPDRS